MWDGATSVLAEVGGRPWGHLRGDSCVVPLPPRAVGVAPLTPRSCERGRPQLREGAERMRWPPFKFWTMRLIFSKMPLRCRLQTSKTRSKQKRKRNKNVLVPGPSHQNRRVRVAWSGSALVRVAWCGRGVCSAVLHGQWRRRAQDARENSARPKLCALGGARPGFKDT